MFRRPREAKRELADPSEKPSEAPVREGDTMRRIDLGEWLDATTNNLANEVTFECICSTIKVAEGDLDRL